MIAKVKVSTRNKLSLSQKEEMTSSYVTGTSIRDLAARYKATKSSIYWLLRRRNVKIRPDLYRKHTFNEHYFDEIDTEDKAYILGFLWADGWNNRSGRTRRVAMELHANDIEVLELIKSKIGMSQDVGMRKLRKVGGSRHCVISLNSKHLSNRLNDLGMTARKSLTCVFPEIREDLLHHFVRGYFDGDGSITLNKKNNANFTILSSFKFCATLVKILRDKLNISTVVRNRKDSKINAIAIGGNKNTIRIMDWLYSGATVFLKRKYDKFIRFLHLYSQKNPSLDRSKINSLDRSHIFSKYAIV